MYRKKNYGLKKYAQTSKNKFGIIYKPRKNMLIGKMIFSKY